MKKCDLTSTQLENGNWEHVCAACGGRYVTPSRKYTRGCPAKKTIRVISARERFPERTTPCAHLGPVIREETCKLCGSRGKIREVRECAIWGTCTPQPYALGQPEQRCRGCDQYSAIPPAEMTAPENLAPVTNPYGITPPPNCTPLPAGRDTFNGTEWRALSRPEQDYYRAVRKAREAANPSPPAAGPPVPTLPAGPAPAGPPASTQTPFWTPDGRPAHLSHIGQGASCFIVLGGPSLLTYDLSKLQRRGAWSIGVNNVSAVVKTNAWCSVDSVSKFCDAIWQDPSILKFVNRRFLQRSVRTRGPDGSFGPLLGSDGRQLLVREFPAVFGVDRNADFEPSRFLSEPTVNWGLSKRSHKRCGQRYPQVLNSMFFVVKLAYALGFRVAYLLGCDFQMRQDRPYAFPQTKASGGVNSNNGSYAKMNEMFRLLQPHFLAAGFHVFNCNAESGLSAFPHVGFDKAIQAATAKVPQDETGEGWYNGHAGD